MWLYKQSTGQLFHLVATGYAGRGEGKNNAAMEYIHGVGPLPEGKWQMQAPIDSDHLGPFAIPLFPVSGTTTRGRSGFFCHGDSISDPGNASDGCIIMPRSIREQMWNSGEHDLVVEP